ncbi:MAG: lysine 2,3-aminomutase, partial [Thermovirga sp.]|nr:lysine 2,3-aminomutase [Thermovirga sp.]
MPSLDRNKVPLWKGVPDSDWNDWKWQVTNRIVTVDQLRQVIDIDGDEAEVVGRSLGKLRMAITPYFASLMDPNDPRCPIRMQAIPTENETRLGKSDLLDPLHED